jgi:hypothetical protein
VRHLLKFFGFSLAYLVVCVGILWPAPAKADIVQDVLGCPGDPCVVTFNPGGSLREFEEAAEAIRNGARSLVVVDGMCASACTILLDRIPDKVCLTQMAQLRFHKGTRYVLKWINYTLWDTTATWGPYSARELIDIEYAPKAETWIRSVGGLPKDGSTITMPSEIAETIWHSCARVPLPRPRPAKLRVPKPRTAQFSAHGLY